MAKRKFAGKGENKKDKPHDILTEMEDILHKVETAQPRLKNSNNSEQGKLRSDDLEALLDISKAINSTLVLDDILQVVMKRAIKLLRAERGFLMLLDNEGQLQYKTAYNICKESLSSDDFRISMSIANTVAKNGESIYTSDAQQDERFSRQKSVRELDLKSIMCVPLKSKEKIVGILYLDNSSKTNIFLKSDLYVFELFAGQAAIAIENAKLYESLLAMKIYNENVVNRTPIGIMVVDNELKITIANRASQEIFRRAGWKDGSGEFGFTNLSILDLLPSKEKENWKRICYQVLYTGQPFEESRYYHKFETEELALSLKISPLNSLDNRIMGLIIVIEDITEKVILEKYLILSEKLVAKGEMAASIGHELNNYLTIILNNAELLPINLKKGDLEKVHQNTKSILESVETMKRFTDGLMDFSKLEAKLVEYDIKSLIEDLLFSVKPQKQFSNIKFITNFDTQVPHLLIDVGQIQQVLLNLLNNAADAINKQQKSDGMVTISTHYRSELGVIQIGVKDNGPGIPEELIDRIFEPRFTTKKDGHGFGLVTCEKIVKNHGGSISTDSVLGKGATFTIELPVKKEQKITDKKLVA
ncbi:MAG: ATP-binding protein [candidate division Zixibacteria bacterium]|nr:ATP-binding protein [candidate division Zixibacteria bacterium]